MARPPRTWWAGRTGGSGAGWSMARVRLPWSGPPLGPSFPDSAPTGPAVRLPAHPHLASGSQPQCPDPARLTGTHTRRTYVPGHEGSGQENLTSCLQAQTRSGRWPWVSEWTFPLRQEASVRERLPSFGASPQPSPGQPPLTPPTSGFTTRQSPPLLHGGLLSFSLQTMVWPDPGHMGLQEGQGSEFQAGLYFSLLCVGSTDSTPFHG